MSELLLLTLTPRPETVPSTLMPPAPVFVIFTRPLPETLPALAIFTPSTPVFSIVTSPEPKFLTLPAISTPASSFPYALITILPFSFASFAPDVMLFVFTS